MNCRNLEARKALIKCLEEERQALASFEDRGVLMDLSIKSIEAHLALLGTEIKYPNEDIECAETEDRAFPEAGPSWSGGVAC